MKVNYISFLKNLVVNLISQLLQIVKSRSFKDKKSEYINMCTKIWLLDIIQSESNIKKDKLEFVEVELYN